MQIVSLAALEASIWY